MSVIWLPLSEEVRLVKPARRRSVIWLSPSDRLVRLVAYSSPPRSVIPSSSALRLVRREHVQVGHGLYRRDRNRELRANGGLKSGVREGDCRAARRQRVLGRVGHCCTPHLERLDVLHILAARCQVQEVHLHPYRVARADSRVADQRSEVVGPVPADVHGLQVAQRLQRIEAADLIAGNIEGIEIRVLQTSKVVDPAIRGIQPHEVLQIWTCVTGVGAGIPSCSRTAVSRRGRAKSYRYVLRRGEDAATPLAPQVADRDRVGGTRSQVEQGCR